MGIAVNSPSVATVTDRESASLSAGGRDRTQQHPVVSIGSGSTGAASCREQQACFEASAAFASRWQQAAGLERGATQQQGIAAAMAGAPATADSRIAVRRMRQRLMPTFYRGAAT